MDWQCKNTCHKGCETAVKYGCWLDCILGVSQLHSSWMCRRRRPTKTWVSICWGSPHPVVPCVGHRWGNQRPESHWWTMVKLALWMPHKVSPGGLSWWKNCGSLQRVVKRTSTYPQIWPMATLPLCARGLCVHAGWWYLWAFLQCRSASGHQWRRKLDFAGCGYKNLGIAEHCILHCQHGCSWSERQILRKIVQIQVWIGRVR